MRFTALVVSPWLLLVACTPSEPPVGEGGEGEGEGEGEEEGEGEGEGEEGCTSATCAADEECGSIFGADAAPSCYARCAVGDEPCALATGGVGECRSIDGFTVPVCRAQNADLAACGNPINAGCAGDASVCVFFSDRALFQDPSLGICVQGCATDSDCGDAALGCSQDLRFTVDGGDPLGVCAPTSTAGESCGRLGDGRLVLCTGDQRCDRVVGASQGICRAP